MGGVWYVPPRLPLSLSLVLSETLPLESLGLSSLRTVSHICPPFTPQPESVLSSPLTLHLPLLLLANKQDSPLALSSTEIRESYEVWVQARKQRTQQAGGHNRRLSTMGSDAVGGGGTMAEEGSGAGEGEGERGGSLEVLGVSGLEG